MKHVAYASDSSTPLRSTCSRVVRYQYRYYLRNVWLIVCPRSHHWPSPDDPVPVCDTTYKQCHKPCGLAFRDLVAPSVLFCSFLRSGQSAAIRRRLLSQPSTRHVTCRTRHRRRVVHYSAPTATAPAPPCSNCAAAEQAQPEPPLSLAPAEITTAHGGYQSAAAGTSNQPDAAVAPMQPGC
jgi:hypothetical protein